MTITKQKITKSIEGEHQTNTEEDIYKSIVPKITDIHFLGYRQDFYYYEFTETSESGYDLANNNRFSQY